ncbi:TPA: hypothetical protein HA231_03490 [Candidatus Woesearchaeota archaeon]|nr:hypothetical protein [Candidatus Woesearchaeota archaeon]
MAVLSDKLREDFWSLLGNLDELNVAIIVEGKKDKAALEALGISPTGIFVLNKQPIFAVAEAVAKECNVAVILTDLDSEGRKLYGKFNMALQQLGTKVDNRIRNFIFRNTKVRQVEGLATIHQP